MSIKNSIPNFITLLNLLCGCLAIVAAFETNLVLASVLVFAGAFFDYFDGMAARILHAKSEIGKQLDSLADVVTFGVVPAIISYKLLQIAAVNNAFITNNNFLLYIPFIIALFSALRLAKFNIDSRQTTSFLGLPTPANAIFWASAPLIIYYKGFEGINVFGQLNVIIASLFQNAYFLIAFSILMSALLIIEIPLFSLKMKDLSWKNNMIQYIFLITAFCLLLVLNFTALPIIILIYILFSIFQYSFNHSKKQ
ncbi:MAG: CDP-diacylglycerol--serine O-phosphatidyltransferase [Bacteroidetes bacterium]|nr:CDP-diacylglycerol--serine O-phosphatidyltransferase [Bacteroidota bacterium]